MEATDGEAKGENAVVDEEVQMPKDATDGTMEGPERMALSGMKLQLLTLTLCLSLFLSLLDSTIVSTALVHITNSLGGFERSSWIVNTYLLTYTGTSDRQVNIVFRAFQGIGGAAMYTMVFVMLPEMCTPDQYTLYSTIISCVATMSSLLGPIFGGLISQRTSWRWIFWLKWVSLQSYDNPQLTFYSVPTGIFCLMLLYIAVPAHFPYAKPSEAPKISRTALQKVDIMGTLILLAATTLLLTALEESGTGHAWTSAIVLAPLISGVALYITFVAWSKIQATRTTDQEPLVPWHILTDRFCLGLFASAFWMGAMLFSLTVTLPQRFQVVDRSSALSAGYRLLPVTLVDPLGSAVGAYFMTSMHVPPFYLLLIGTAIQTLGVGLMIMRPSNLLSFPASKYGFEAITGFGLGITSAIAVLAATVFFKPKDLSVGMGGVGQFRSLGGAIGVAISVNILNRYTTDELSGTLSVEQMGAIKLSAEAVGTFPEPIQKLVREAYARGFGWQAVAMTGFGGMGVLMMGLMVERKMRKLLNSKAA
ncbi:hypothetical protein N0V90_011035 [Kalmusia sp. IMI 367209]|nr:hypothetical protein N0V90_011035 [Kalmusia sp. IMI 367209]